MKSDPVEAVREMVDKAEPKPGLTKEAAIKAFEHIHGAKERGPLKPTSRGGEDVGAKTRLQVRSVPTFNQRPTQFLDAGYGSLPGEG